MFVFRINRLFFLLFLGAMYGNGTYFAVDPSYSVKSYCKPDAKGHKRIYLAKVLVGDFTQGKKGLRTPPKRSSKGVHLYDSVTDKLKTHPCL